MRIEKWIYAGLILMGAFSIFIVGFQVSQIALNNCREIESLKDQFRDDAREDFEELPENLKLFGFPPPTPEALDVARANRDEVFRRFPREACHRKFLW